MVNNKGQHPAEKLAYHRQNAWDRMNNSERNEAEVFCREYMGFLGTAKTEREAVEATQVYLEGVGFRPLLDNAQLKPGDKVYITNRCKTLIAAVIGKKPVVSGLNIIGAHLDSPRLDLKPQPLYEDDGMALLKTHYYGGIKKYQWLSVPLALHGVVIKNDGTTVSVVIGEKQGEPSLLCRICCPTWPRIKWIKKWLMQFPEKV